MELRKKMKTKFIKIYSFIKIQTGLKATTKLSNITFDTPEKTIKPGSTLYVLTVTNDIASFFFDEEIYYVNIKNILNARDNNNIC
jgi:hypothetical protein